MKKGSAPTLLIVLIAVAVVGFFLLRMNTFDLPEGEAIPLTETLQDGLTGGSVEDNDDTTTTESGNVDVDEDNLAVTSSSLTSSREVFVTDDVKHSIPIDQIRQGCFGRDCIPSVDDPEFVDPSEADKLFRTEGISAEEAIGISLSYNGATRFYPFSMLVTREIVNDVVGGQPLAVTYCPLCGTGIVFNRVHDGETLEFGVSGLLWQSNLLMYNRNDDEENVSLWSQVLGESVLGTHTGAKLSVIPSDVITFAAWRDKYPNGEVLNTGRIGDPYRGDYYGVARGFRPSFDEGSSPLDPSAYVFGIEIDGEFKAYENDALPVGTTNDTFAGTDIRIEKEESGVVRIYGAGIPDPLPVVTGFWFSWVAAHPETELYN